jgi:MoxR-like ATPase
MLIATTGSAEDKPIEVMSADDLIAAQRLVRRVPVGESVVNAILTLVRNGRAETTNVDEVRRHVAWGPGPRASQALMLACRARALLGGRFAPSVDDVVALAHPILRHRMALNFTARADGVTLNEVIDRLCAPLR